MPMACIVSSAFATLAVEVTPNSECVVAPAGYSLTAVNTPSSKPRRSSSGGVPSQR